MSDISSVWIVTNTFSFKPWCELYLLDPTIYTARSDLHSIRPYLDSPSPHGQIRIWIQCPLVFSSANCAEIVHRNHGESRWKESISTSESTTGDHSTVLPIYLVDAHSAPLAPTVSLYHPSDYLPSAAELFRLPPPRSGTHCRTVSSP